MAPTLHLVRHAQGFHNLSTANQNLPDPELTELGRQQCADLQARFPFHEQLTHLVASPMTRTLRTCLLSFAPALERDPELRVLALPEVQEVSILPCDVGRDPAELARNFEGEPVDLARVVPGWNHKGKGSPWAPEMDKLEARARAARRFLRELLRSSGNEDAQVAVVTHGGFLHFLTEDWDGMRPEKGTGWDNAEYRSYVFADPSGQDENASLKETHTSWRARRGSTIGLTDTEQRELRAVVQDHMEKEFKELEAKRLTVQFDEEDKE